MERLYSGAIIAQQRLQLDVLTSRTNSKYTTLTFFAHNKHEATGIALEFCQNKYPSADGYFNHGVVVMEVAADTIYRAHELLESENN